MTGCGALPVRTSSCQVDTLTQAAATIPLASISATSTSGAGTASSACAE
ncbi:hypothetical protein RBXJA2T_16557 [Rubrivivax benzoatilyticus JA2 = ATCC BAA-35]|nr:hypothetical protein RBXJA2T_16557 [Rubrivivax benzoatilyticus JA2 = ATCC BAA-35]